MHELRPVQPIACLPMPSELDERHSPPHPGLIGGRVDLDHPLERRLGFGQSSGEAQRVGQPHPGVHVVRPAPDRGLVARDRLAVATVAGQQLAQTEVRVGKVRGHRQRRFELRHRAADVARHAQRHAETVPQRRIVRRQRETGPERRRRLGVATGTQRTRAASLVGQRAVQQADRLLQERVGESRRSAAPLPQILLRQIQPAQLPVRHAEAVVEARRPRIDGQRALQIRGGPRGVLTCERGASDAGEDRGRGRLQRQRPVVHPLGFHRLPLIEEHLAEPDQRRQVLRIELDHVPEVVERPSPLSRQLVQMGEVVRPAGRAGHLRPRVQVGVLRRSVEPGRLQHQAEVAEGFAERFPRRSRPAGERQHRRVPGSDLVLHGRLESHQPGQDDHRGRRACCGSLPGRGSFFGRRTAGDDDQHRSRQTGS